MGEENTLILDITSSESVERGQIEVKRVYTDEQKADLLTKPLAAGKFAVMRHLIGVRDVSAQQD